MDILTPEERSHRMSLIRAKNTKVELVVRRLIYRMGYRYRLHVRYLPGTPDLVFIGKKSIIFVHGCFWHGHNRCKKARIPRTNIKYWKTKIDDNKWRDASNVDELRNNEWNVLIVWECQLKDFDSLSQQISRFLGPPHRLKTN